METTKTIHGIINHETKKYVTERRPEHYFKKYQGFGISDTELEKARKEGAKTIIIKYHTKTKTIIYMTNINNQNMKQKYTNGEDEQTIIPISELTIIGTEQKWTKAWWH